eukprot:302638_1
MSTQKYHGHTLNFPCAKTIHRPYICVKQNKMHILIILTVLVCIAQFSTQLTHISNSNILQHISSSNHLSRNSSKHNNLHCDEIFQTFNFTRKKNTHELNTTNEIKIYNVFPYDGEKELLLTRLHELSDIIDYFIIVESKRSYNPIRKLYKRIKFNQNDTTFQQFSSQILHLIISDEPYNAIAITNKTIRFREWFRSHVISEFLIQFKQYFPQPNDLFLGTDLDELTTYEILLPFKQCNLNQYNIPWPIAFELKWYIYDFGCQAIQNWRHKPSLTPFHMLFGNPNCTKTCFTYRQFGYYKNIKVGAVIGSAGWHMSYFMSLRNMREKLNHAGDKKKSQVRNHEHIDCYVSTCHHITDHGVDTLPRSKTIYNELNSLCKQYKFGYPKFMVHESCRNHSDFVNFFPTFGSFSKCNYTEAKSIVENVYYKKRNYNHSIPFDWTWKHKKNTSLKYNAFNKKINKHKVKIPSFGKKKYMNKWKKNSKTKIKTHNHLEKQTKRTFNKQREHQLK